MGYPPGQSISVRDGGIGLVSTQSALPLIVGVTSAGSANTLYQFSDPNALQDELNDGPAVEVALPTINAAGGCIVLKTAASTAGSTGAVTPTRVGSSTGTITLAGTPKDSYEVIVKITATGSLGAGRFSYSLDDGYTYSPEITIPAGGVYTLGSTGVTMTFVPGAGPVFFELGDKHEFDCVAPHWTTADLSAAWTALLAQIGSRKIRQVALAGKHTSGANAATAAAAVATHMSTLQANHYYARAIMDAGNDTAGNVKTAFANFADARVNVVFGDCDIVTFNADTGRGTPKMPAMNTVFERAAGARLSENLGRFASGSLRGVVALSHDEGNNAQFSDADKITTLRTYRGIPGFYVTNGYLRSGLGSDFKFWEWGMVIDEICETVYEAQQKFVLSSLRAKIDGSGNIDPKDAARVESVVRAALKARLLDPVNAEGTKGHVSAVNYAVDLTNDFLATQEMLSAATAVPRPPVVSIPTVVGFARSAA